MSDAGTNEKSFDCNHKCVKDLPVCPPKASGSAPTTDRPKKSKFSKLWICKKSPDTPPTSKPKCTLKRSATKSKTNFSSQTDPDENTRRQTVEESTQTLFIPNSIIQTCDVFTDTDDRFHVVNIGISCKCETSCRASGPDTWIEIRCVEPGRSLAIQTDANVETEVEKERDKWIERSSTGRSSSSMRREDSVKASKATKDDDLIYERMKIQRSPYQIEFAEKPKYQATCESCDSSTDKWVSISHNVCDAAFGSSIIIAVPAENTRSYEKTFPYWKQRETVSCDVCTSCTQLPERRCSTSTVLGDESTIENSGINHQWYSKDNYRRETHFRPESLDTNEDHKVSKYRSMRGSDILSGSSIRKGSKGRRSGRSKSDSEKQQNKREVASTFLNKIGRLKDSMRREKRTPLLKTSRLSLTSIESSPESLRPLETHEIDPWLETKFQTRRECKINDSTEDFDEIILRRNRSRSGNTKKMKEFDKNVQSFGCNWDKTFMFTRKKLKNPIPGTNKFDHFFTDCSCGNVEYNNFGKRYSWDRPVDTNARQSLESWSRVNQKFCKCGNGCGGTKSRNKYCCRE